MLTEEQAKQYRMSKNFTLWEFLYSTTAIHHGIMHEQMQIDEKSILNLKRLCENVLQPLRNKFGSITITSGYRSPQLNKALNGAMNSEHMQGKAADIVFRDMPKGFVFLKTLQFRQLIDEYNFRWIHVSYDEFDNKKHVLKLPKI